MTESNEKILEIVSGMKRFLTTRERCRSEADIYLRKKGFDSENIRMALDYLIDEGFIDEFRYSKNRVFSRMGRGYGPLFIKNELQQLRIPEQIISESMALADEEIFLENAVEFIEKKLPVLISDEKAEEKLFNGLKYRGFTGGQIQKSIDTVKIKYPHWSRKRKQIQYPD